MPRITALDPQHATGHVKELLEGVGRKLGMVPNMMRTMAQAPAVLEGYLQFSGALGHGQLSAKVREQIALAVAEANGCDYCLAAHTAIGKMVGLSADQLRDSRQGESVDPGTDALLRFARQVVETRGHVNDADVQAVRDAGFGDGVIAEVVAGVALDIFTNYFNIVAATEVDFPRAPAL
ncbi:Carboxymuconolactone decarboxylase family protein [Planctopirus ephydatiae]|uniref:Carboxymuconolactone decarboxylase family protein n=1 Tax=Planctopirus ephydatiae TaxID=2528019 RepID=A0A518GSC2_9PLAN|nr:carboxymuconolactone decarboxylase family protein [Planctopirus ephydatiae]QDV31483.1 Carboxymuconolactone decarboxylase family protein [Planctopirus ephydatiae]